MGQFDHNLSMMGYNVAKLQNVDERSKLAMYHLMTSISAAAHVQLERRLPCHQRHLQRSDNICQPWQLGLALLGRAGVKQTTKQGFKELNSPTLSLP